jgi:hypothetical protein
LNARVNVPFGPLTVISRDLNDTVTPSGMSIVRVE